MMALPRRSTSDSVDPYVIRYLEGSTTSSPVLPKATDRPDLQLVGREAIQTGRLMAALSTALDLTEGQLPGHSLRTCYLAMRLAEALGLTDAERETLFFAAFLKDAGCSSNAAAVTRIFGVDDITLKGRQSTIDRSIIAYAAFAIRNLPAAEPLPLRLRRLIKMGLSGRTAQRAVEQIRCERGASIARKAGFGEAVASTVHDVHEHWDGGGNPRGLKGQAIDPMARILAACQGLDVFVSTKGRPDAIRVLAQRRGTWYDPDVAGALLDETSVGLLDDLAAPDLVGRTMSFEPDSVIRLSDDTAIDRIASSFADIVDAKSPYTGSHSKHVAELAEGVAIRMGLPPEDVIDVRRAGLLHDLGKLGVPNMILDKPGPLESEEFEIIKRHPELTLRILTQIPTFASVAELAACHHERLDGRGYFRGLTAPSIALGARIVAVADVWEALSADRPYRPAMPTDRALAIMREETGDHLAADAVAALTGLVA
jgi:putative nucleotidyltransferase with HDIG domain